MRYIAFRYIYVRSYIFSNMTTYVQYVRTLHLQLVKFIDVPSYVVCGYTTCKCCIGIQVTSYKTFRF